MPVKSTISLNDMRERVGRAIFGADWIGGLSADEWELLGMRGPQQRRGKRGTKTPHSDPYLVDGFRITRQRDEHIAQEMGETSLPKAL
jgi:hypothetical protein